jgi:hypothetical protein
MVSIMALRQVEPRQLFVPEKVLGGLQWRGIVESADVEMRFRRQSCYFARQRGTAPLAEAAHRAGRRSELGDLAAGHDIGAVLETDEHGNRRTAVPSAALAMTPENRFGPTRGGKSDGATETATFKFFHERLLALDGG